MSDVETSLHAVSTAASHAADRAWDDLERFVSCMAITLERPPTPSPAATLSERLRAVGPQGELLRLGLMKIVAERAAGEPRSDTWLDAVRLAQGAPADSPFRPVVAIQEARALSALGLPGAALDALRGVEPLPGDPPCVEEALRGERRRAERTAGLRR